MLLHIGIDDTDSPSGGCTTYIAALLVELLLELQCEFVDYPNLLRLNPNAPWKTRGNGAVCLRVNVDEVKLNDIKKMVIDIIEDQGKFECDNTNPGVVFHIGDIPIELENFSDSVVQTIVTLEEAEALINKYCSSAVAWKNRRGLIGALAAIGGTLKGDHTYELLTYRVAGNRGTERQVNKESVIQLEKICDNTFNNIDPETKQVLIAPRGADPVLYGVRGETPEDVHRALEIISVNEPIERWVIFRTNQGTDFHLARSYSISDLKPYFPGSVFGHVHQKAKIIVGGHLILVISDGTGVVDCAAYEPTGGFRKVISGLIESDEVGVAGGVRDLGNKLTLNLEKIELKELAVDRVFVNPRCPKCGSGTESMGQQQGFRCKKCGFREIGQKKESVERKRSLTPGLYLPPPRAQRHLTKPLKRYGREQSYRYGQLFAQWHS